MRFHYTDPRTWIRLIGFLWFTAMTIGESISVYRRKDLLKKMRALSVMLLDLTSYLCYLLIYMTLFFNHVGSENRFYDWIQLVLIAMVLEVRSLDIFILRGFNSSKIKLLGSIGAGLLMMFVCSAIWNNIYMRFGWFVVGYCIQYVGIINYWYYVQMEEPLTRAHCVAYYVTLQLYEALMLAYLITEKSLDYDADLIHDSVCFVTDIATRLISTIVLVMILRKDYKSEEDERNQIVSYFPVSQSSQILTPSRDRS